MSTVIGSVSFLEGQVVAVAPDGTERVLALGDQVMVDDVIRTGPDASIEITMMNGEPLALAPGQTWLAAEAGMATAELEGGVGVVSITTGQVVVVAADGSERVLMAGDVIYADEVIRTSPDGRAEITMESGNSVTLSGGQSWLASADTYTPADQFDTSEATADVAALQQAILAGQDPTELLEPTAAGAAAAGAPAGGNEGADFIQLDRTAGETTPEAGYETIGLDYTVLTPEGEDPILDEQSVAVPLIASDLDNNQLVIEEDGTGSFSVTATVGEASDVISQIAISNLPTGATVSGSDGGSYNSTTGVYTTNGNPSSVTLTIGSLTPVADSDVDLGSIGFTATAQDGTDSTLTSSAGTSVSVITDAVLDQFGDLDATAQNAAESNSGSQTLSLGASMTLADAFQSGDSDGDGSESISVVLSLSSALPTGVTLSSTVGTLTPVSGSNTDYILTANSGSTLSEAVAGLQATVPQGWDGVINGTLTSTATDTPTGGGDVEPDTADNTRTDSAGFSLTVTGDVQPPTVTSSLEGNQLVIEEDGTGSFSVTATVGEASDVISQIAISNLPTGATVSGSDGGSYNSTTGVYTTNGNPSSVTLTIGSLTPVADSDVDLGSIGFTATAQDGTDSTLTSSAGTSVSVITDAVLDQFGDLDATAQNAAESNSGSQTLSLGASMTLADAFQSGDSDGDGSESISVVLSLSSALPTGVTLSSTVGTLTPVSGSNTDYILTANSGSTLSEAVAGLQATVPQGWDGVINGTLTSTATDTPTGGGDVEPDTADNTRTDSAGFSLTVTGDVQPPTVTSSLEGNQLVIEEDGTGSFSVTATVGEASDVISQIAISNLPTGATVSGSDGGSYNSTTGVYTTNGNPSSVTLTIGSLTPVADSDVDLGSIGFTATAQDGTDSTLTSSAGTSVSVITDAVLDQFGDLDATAQNAAESNSGSQTLSLGASMTLADAFQSGDSDGDGSESISVVLSLSSALPTGVTLSSTVGTLTPVSGSNTDYILTANSGSTLSEAVAGLQATVPQGWDGVINGTLTSTATDTPTGGGDVEPDTADNTRTDSAGFSLTVTGDVQPPTVTSSLEGNQLVIEEDGTGSFSVTATVGEASDVISQIAISNLPTGATVSGSDGGSYNSTTGVYTTNGNPSSVTLTIGSLTPVADSDVDLGSIGFTATAQDGTDSTLTSSAGTSVSVITDAVLDQFGDLDATAQNAAESNSGSQTLSLGASMTLADAFQSGDSDGDGSESISVVLSLSSALPTGVTLSSTVGTLTPVSGSNTDYILTANSGSTLSEAVAGLQATVPQGWDGVINGTLTSTATDTPTGGGDVEPDTADNTRTDSAGFSLTVTGDVQPPTVTSSLEGNQLVIEEDGTGSFSVTATVGEASDVISQIAISNLPTGATVSGSDGGSYNSTTGVYTTNGNPSSVTLTIGSLTPVADSDVDLGSIGFTATAQDGTDSTLTSSAGTSVSVITDAVLDQFGDLDATAQNAAESNSGSQTLSLGASMILADAFQSGDSDGDGSESISVVLSLSSALPTGVTLSSTVGTLTPVSGSNTDYILTANSGSTLSEAVAGLQATVPQGWDGVINGTLTSTATDTPTGGGDVEPDTADNTRTDSAGFSLTVTGDVQPPTVTSSLEGNQLVIEEDGTGSFSVTATVGEASDVISQIAISNLPTGATVSGSDGGSYNSTTGVYTTNGNPSSVTLTIGSLTPVADSDVDLGSIGFTATAQDGTDSTLTSSAGTSVSVITDAVLDQFGDLDATAQNAAESNSGSQTLSLGASMTLADAFQSGDSDGDGSESISVVLSLSSALPTGVTLSSTVGTLTPVSGSNTDYILTANSGSTLSEAVAGLQATVPQGWDGVINGTLTSTATDTPTGGGDVEPDTADNTRTDSAGFSLTVTGDVQPPTVTSSLEGNQLVIEEDGTGSFSVTATVGEASDVISQIAISNLPTGATVSGSDGGSYNSTTGVYTTNGNPSSVTLTIGSLTPVADSDVDLGSIGFTATAQDGTDSTLTSSAGTSVSVITDAVLDQFGDLDATAQNAAESNSGSQTLSLGASMTLADAFQSGDSDGDGSESISVVLSLSSALPTGVTLSSTVGTLTPVSGSNTDYILTANSGSTLSEAVAGLQATVPQGWDGVINGTLTSTATDTPTGGGDVEPDTADNTRTDSAGFSLTVTGDVQPPTVTSSLEGNQLVIEEDGTGSFSVTATVGEASDVISQIAISNLPTGATVSGSDGGSYNSTTGVYTTNGNPSSVTLTIGSLTPVADSDVDLGSIGFTATAQDGTDSTLTSSAGTSVSVITDAVLDQFGDLDATAQNAAESNSGSQTLSLGASMTLADAFQSGDSDGDGSESISVVLSLSSALPTGVTLSSTVGTLTPVSGSNTDYILTANSGSTLSEAVAGLQATVPQGWDGVINGTLTSTATDTPTGGGDVEPDTADNTRTDSAGFSLTVSDGEGPTGGGNLSMTLNEAALDTALNGDDDSADLAAGSVTGSTPDALTETDSASVSFTAGSTDPIVGVGFADPQVTGNMPVVLDADSNPVSISWSLNVTGQLIGQIGGETAIILELSGDSAAAANGTANVVVTATLTANFPHSEVNTAGDSISVSGIKVLATDTDNESAVANVNLTILDDAPSDIAPVDATVDNSVGASVSGVALDSDFNIDDAVGADQQGVLSFKVPADPDSGYTSAGQPIYLYISSDGQTLIGSTVEPTVPVQTADATAVQAAKVFTLTLNTDGDYDSQNDTYSVDVHQLIDGGSGSFNVTDSGYDFVGGNDPYSYFLDPTANNNDVLLTPMIGGVSDGTTNTNDNAGGVGGGNSVGTGEAMRVDYVSGISGDPKANVGGDDYSNVLNQDHVFDGHYMVNGASAVFTNIASSTTIRIKAFDDPDTNNVVGDGTSDEITRVVISYDGVSETFNVSGYLDGVATTATVNGHDFTITTDGNDVLVGNVISDSTLGVSTQDGLNSVEYHHAGGDTFKIGGFGALAFEPGADVSMNFDLVLEDADGDTAAGSLTVDFLGETAVADPVLLVGTNVDDTNLSSTLFAVSPQGDSFGSVVGREAADILIGDVGGAASTVVPGVDYNIALVVDVSGSMDEGSGTYDLNGEELSRLELLQKALVNLAGQFADHDGTINIALIPFANDSRTSVDVSLQDLASGNLSDLTDAINSLSADGGTNYEAAFDTAVDWFEGADTGTGYTNLTYFLTDGDPTLYLKNNGTEDGPGASTDRLTLQNSVDAFAALSALSAVHGVGIGSGVNSDYLTFFDNTDNIGTHTVTLGSWFWAQDVTGPGGNVDIVNTEDELNAALQGGGLDQALADTGDDLIAGNSGDDILFGDSINTDELADNQGLDTADGVGWDVFDALEDGQGTDDNWNRADTAAYIRDNHAELAVESQGDDSTGRNGGNDILIGGKGDDIIYGQEGDDDLYGGAGDDNLSGGSGSDTFHWQNGDQGRGANIAQDMILDFDQTEGDSINIADLLQGEDGNDMSALLNYVSVTEVSGDTIISVSHEGGAAAGVDQTITLQGVALADLGVADSASQADILNTLVNNGIIVVDNS